MTSCLQSRYEDLRIYTYIGNVLIAINPFQTVNIYDEQVRSAYINIKNQTYWFLVANFVRIHYRMCVNSVLYIGTDFICIYVLNDFVYL